MMDQRYDDIASFLKYIVEMIEDDDLEGYANNPDDLIDLIVDDLLRKY